jgi:polyhydroxybutyrate depolymerase
MRAPRAFFLVVVLALAVGACSSAHSAGSTSSSVAAGGSGRATGRAVPSAGCSTPAPAPVNLARQDMTVDGAARWYLLTTPAHPQAHKAVPVVVDMHGLIEGATLHAQTTQFGPKAASTGFIAVFPNGTGSPVSWDISTRKPNADLDFIKAMLSQLEANMCVDTSRVYATGLSDGAFLTSVLACTMANTFAAFAPVSGIFVPSPCHPARRVPIMAFHGTADPIVLFNGGIGATLNHLLGGPAPPPTTLPPTKLSGKGIPLYVKRWAALDHCAPRLSDRHVSKHVVLRTYQCPAGAAVEFYIVLGGGHSWPGSKVSASLDSVTGPTTFEINATNLIWKFFEQYQLS